MTAALLGSMKEGIGPKVAMRGYEKIVILGMEDDEIKINFYQGGQVTAEVFANDDVTEDIPSWADQVEIEHIEASGAPVTVRLE